MSLASLTAAIVSISSSAATVQLIISKRVEATLTAKSVAEFTAVEAVEEVADQVEYVAQVAAVGVFSGNPCLLEMIQETTPQKEYKSATKDRFKTRIVIKLEVSIKLHK